MTDPRRPSVAESLLPIAALIFMLALSVNIFGADSSSGPNQIVLILCTAIAAIVAIKNGHTWSSILDAIVNGIGTAMGAIMILLAVGSLIGTWLMAGTVPSMIYYGLVLLNPKVFYFATCLICIIASISIGSSWTVAGTLGVALIGVSMGLGLSPEIAAGAIISGAYFGDKMSPLSDSTNLAPAVTGTDLFTHIRHMVWTTGPSIVITLIIFAVIGSGVEPGASNSPEALQQLSATLANNFNITPLTLIPLFIVFFMAYKKVPPLPTILFGALLGGFVAMLLQADVVLQFANAPDLPPALAMTKGVWVALSDGFTANTGIAEFDDLLSRGGMSSMLITIWLILTALAFGSVLEHSGILLRLIESSLKAARSTGSLILTVILSSIGINIVAADQYISIVLPGRMYKAEFKKRGLAPENLSRAVEDSGTLTSPLVPWNTCGAYMAATLGVATFAYLPYVFFNLINPVVSVIYGFTGFSIRKIKPQAQS